MSQPLGIGRLHPDAFSPPLRYLRLRNPAMDTQPFTQALQQNGVVYTADSLPQAANQI